MMAIDLLLSEIGTVKNRMCVGEFTAKQALERAGVPNTELNWNYVIHLLKNYYPGSRWERGSQDNGYNLRVKTRVR